jgi:hypothetical protein
VEVQDEDVRIIIKWILKKVCLGVDWIELDQDRVPAAGSCEHDNNTFGSNKRREIEELRD